MVTFKYSFLSKLIYRYANIPLTLFLGLYMVSSFAFMMQKWYYVFPFLLNLIIIIALNRHYFRTYKLFPFRIDANNHKLICSDYFNKSKHIEINLYDIDEIEGGVISGTPAKPIYIHDDKNDVVVGISPHLKDSNKLVTIILSNVNQDLYDHVLNSMQELKFSLPIKTKKKPVR